MKILIVAYVWPEPDSSAAGSRMMQLIRFFQSQSWAVTFASPATDSAHMLDIESLGVSRVRIALNDESFDRFVRDLAPDIVMFDRFMMEEQFGWRVEKHCPNAIRMLDTEDLHCLREARHRALRAGREMTTDDLFSDVAKREVAAIFRCDLTLMISEVEIALLVERFGVSPSLLQHTPFMLDASEVSRSDWPGYEARVNFISIGNFRHAPNWDAVLQLREVIWPLIRAKLPAAELHVYGAYAPPKATQLHHPKGGFLMRGWAENVGQVMREARICLAPLRFGAGLKGKLVDAMRHGTPSITTSIGAEGMQGLLPWCGVVADKAEDFAAAAIRLYGEEKGWQKAQQNGVELLNQNYARTDHEQALSRRLEQVRVSLSEHRLENFMGAMLRHHLLKSTQYMAQWIEAKNKNMVDQDPETE